MTGHNTFATLPSDRRIWAVAAVHGEALRLTALHRHLTERLQEGDRIVYLGNYVGRGPQVRETIDELLDFRRRAMARFTDDGGIITYLRGQQEEMWQKLLQLQFAPNPPQVLQWMLDQGVGATIAAYGGDSRAGFAAAREGILSLTRWTAALRQSMRGHDGHTALMSTLKHAAYTEGDKLLFVHAGVDPSRPLSAQADSFWWGAPGFATLKEPYNGYKLVVRGFDRRREGVTVGDFSASLDGGCGFGGALVAACFDTDGKPGEILEG
jgi:serine/threonine protein phosphatase 1